MLGLLGGAAAYLLVRLIALLTNVALFHRIGWELPSFAELPRGPNLILVAMVSGLIVSLIAKWSPEIKGHGIPEAMEAVLVKQSRIRPRTAIAKPASAAIAIGGGGPFGAEGPIIVTGGALGSLLGQVLPVSPSERKILLASGAAAGMAATFGTPLAAVVLVMELLLFEFSTRAFVPLVVSSALAGGVHSAIFGSGPLFEVPTHDFHGLEKLPFFAVLGLLAGLLAVVVSEGLFFVEAGYRRLPVHEFWHPVIGAFGFAMVGLVQPRALGVGYDAIDDVLIGRLAAGTLASLAIAKLLAWWLALGSGTSGGTLAPLLLISGACGSLFGIAVEHVAPGSGIAPSAFGLVAMAATFGAAVGATFASIVFLFELTRDYQIILPLMLATVLAKTVADALLHDNLMTEKLTRRGLRVESDYAADILRTVTVGEMMSGTVHALRRDATVGDARHHIQRDGHGAYPIIDDDDRVIGIIARHDLLDLDESTDGDPALDHSSHDVVTVAPDQTLLVALRALLEEGIGHLPVVSDGRLVGMCTRTDILRARERHFLAEGRQPGWRLAREPARRSHATRTRQVSPLAAVGTEGPVHQYLVVANQTLGGPELTSAIEERLRDGPAQFHVLVPATPAHDLYRNVLHALEGESPDGAEVVKEAEARLASTVSWIEACGGRADGEIGDPDPLTAIADVIGDRHFDEIIVSTFRAPMSRWLRLDLPSRVARSFDLPVAHITGSRAEAS